MNIEIKEKIYNILIKKFKINTQNIKLDSNLKEDLGADSMDLVELNIILEETFQAPISLELLNDKTTVADLIDNIIITKNIK